MIILRSNKILKLPYTLENINKYKSKNNLLRHARFIPGKSEGVFLVDSKTDSLIGYCGWEDNWIVALEVSNEYRRKGFGEKLLDLAISSGCTGLTVDNRNSAAIDLYKKKGFKSTLNNGRRSNMELL
jgi:ribosomal protein S18 acetylase RimI-like enzyme